MRIGAERAHPSSSPGKETKVDLNASAELADELGRVFARMLAPPISRRSSETDIQATLVAPGP
jgi:hypothetical protein